MGSISVDGKSVVECDGCAALHPTSHPETAGERSPGEAAVPDTKRSSVNGRFARGFLAAAAVKNAPQGVYVRRFFMPRWRRTAGMTTRNDGAGSGSTAHGAAGSHKPGSPARAATGGHKVLPYEARCERCAVGEDLVSSYVRYHQPPHLTHPAALEGLRGV